MFISKAYPRVECFRSGEVPRGVLLPWVLSVEVSDNSVSSEFGLNLLLILSFLIGRSGTGYKFSNTTTDK